MLSQTKKNGLWSGLGVDAERNARETLVQIGEAEEPGPIVKRLPPHDLLVIWDMADDEQRSNLLRLAEAKQTSLLVDMVCWKSNVPDVEAVEKLWGPLVLDDLSGAILAIDKMDPELRTLLFRRHVIVHVLEDRNDEIPGADTSEIMSLPDGYFHLEFPDPEAISDVERAFWRGLTYKPFEYYHKELECIIHDFPNELEEFALRWRQGRLADHGFASKEDAISILAPREVEEIKKIAEKKGMLKPGLSANDQTNLPVLFRQPLAGDSFLMAVFDELAESETPELSNRMGTLEAELGWMINRFLAATDVPIGNLEAVKRGAAWARDLMCLGLEATSDGRIDDAAKLLTTLMPAYFLQVGLGLIYPLRRRAQKLLADKDLTSVGHKAAAFDVPYSIALQCLDNTIPTRWPKLEEEEHSALDYHTPLPNELATFSRRSQVEFIDRLLSEGEQLRTLLIDDFECPISSDPPIVASSFVMTALANAASGREATIAPISYQEATVFAERVVGTTIEDFLEEAIPVLTPKMDVDTFGIDNPELEDDALRRLMLRTLRIGVRRLQDAPPPQNTAGRLDRFGRVIKQASHGSTFTETEHRS